MNHCAICLKLTWHCKSTILLKKKRLGSILPKGKLKLSLSSSSHKDALK